MKSNRQNLMKLGKIKKRIFLLSLYQIKYISAKKWCRRLDAWLVRSKFCKNDPKSRIFHSRYY